jgi:hypothetical protein
MNNDQESQEDQEDQENQESQENHKIRGQLKFKDCYDYANLYRSPSYDKTWCTDFVDGSLELFCRTTVSDNNLTCPTKFFNFDKFYPTQRIIDILTTYLSTIDLNTPVVYKYQKCGNNECKLEEHTSSVTLGTTLYRICSCTVGYFANNSSYTNYFFVFEAEIQIKEMLLKLGARVEQKNVDNCIDYYSKNNTANLELNAIIDNTPLELIRQFCCRWLESSVAYINKIINCENRPLTIDMKLTNEDRNPGVRDSVLNRFEHIAVTLMLIQNILRICAKKCITQGEPIMLFDMDNNKEIGQILRQTLTTFKALWPVFKDALTGDYYDSNDDDSDDDEAYYCWGYYDYKTAIVAIDKYLSYYKF